MSTFCFSVQSDAVPGALPRVLEVFAMQGHVPDQCHASRIAGEDAGLVVDLQLAGIDAGEAASLAKRLGRVVSVTGVLYSEKRRCLAA